MNRHFNQTGLDSTCKRMSSLSCSTPSLLLSYIRLCAGPCSFNRPWFLLSSTTCCILLVSHPPKPQLQHADVKYSNALILQEQVAERKHASSLTRSGTNCRTRAQPRTQHATTPQTLAASKHCKNFRESNIAKQTSAAVRVPSTKAHHNRSSSSRM